MVSKQLNLTWMLPILELVWRKEKTSLLLGKDCETCLCHVHFLHLYK